MLTWRRTAFAPASPLRRLALPRWVPRGRAEPVALNARRYGYAPWRFRHRGDLYRVCEVEAVHDEGGRAPRRYFRVYCADGGRYTLFQDLRAGTWHINP